MEEGGRHIPPNAHKQPVSSLSWVPERKPQTDPSAVPCRWGRLGSVTLSHVLALKAPFPRKSYKTESCILGTTPIPDIMGWLVTYFCPQATTPHSSSWGSAVQ